MVNRVCLVQDGFTLLAFCALFGLPCWHSVASAAVTKMYHYLSPPLSSLISEFFQVCVTAG